MWVDFFFKVPGCQKLRLTPDFWQTSRSVQNSGGDSLQENSRSSEANARNAFYSVVLQLNYCNNSKTKRKNGGKVGRKEEREEKERERRKERRKIRTLKKKSSHTDTYTGFITSIHNLAPLFFSFLFLRLLFFFLNSCNNSAPKKLDYQRA